MQIPRVVGLSFLSALTVRDLVHYAHVGIREQNVAMATINGATQHAVRCSIMLTTHSAHVFRRVAVAFHDWMGVDQIRFELVCVGLV